MTNDAPRETDIRLVEAAAWRVHLTETDADSSPEFEAWLQEPGAAQAWAQVSSPWDHLGEHSGAPELIAARRAALGHARRAHAQQKRPRNLQRLARVAAAVAFAAAAGWGALWWSERPADYTTALNERRIVALADGSRVSLDSGSEVTVRYTRNARELQLLHGQARFDVAHDVERPFSVLAGGQKVIATGTAFNIDMAGPKVLVTLIEGHVVVLDENKSAPPPVSAQAPSPVHPSVELRAGQQLAALPERPPEIATANIQRVTAWTNGQLMFDNEPLAAVVARVNRYAATPIAIGDAKVARMRISGVFNTGDIAGFVDIVTRYLPVQAQTNAAGVVTLTRKG